MEGPKDDLKWFGEGFDGFPKRLPEDCVEYMLFIIDARLTQREILSRLELVRKESSKLAGKLLEDYIWQRDGFQLELEVEGIGGYKYLHGVTNYGDSIEDEWLIAYLLRELSKEFPDLWIKVADTDGEFLLIEAANVLPRWLNPEIADNRVWINNGKLRIIPLAAEPQSSNAKTAHVSRSLSVEEAQEIVLRMPETLIHSPLIEAEAFYRLRNYPFQIQNSLHHARVTIPRKLAYVLHHSPSSIAPAVEAFYLRDPISLKLLQAPNSTLAFPPEDLVTVSVRFTRVLYAQLKSQQFSPPIAWKAAIHELEMSGADTSNKPQLERLEMGMKVTSGFEMLLRDPKNSDNRRVREMQILIKDLEDGETLPSDSEIKSWPNWDREDSEAWLDINFEDFEKELAGKTKDNGGGGDGTFGPKQASGFGDAKTQADLKKMVSRFETFLNDDTAGIEGAELDDMDVDDDDEDEDDEDVEDDSEDEDKDVSFDEQEFARMMREMMGLPAEEGHKQDLEEVSRHASNPAGRVQELDSDGDGTEDSEAEEMWKVMASIEAELREAGALDLGPTPSKVATSQNKASAVDLESKKGLEAKQRAGPADNQDFESDSDGEVDIDFNLAKNLLESFKSQAGMAGPGGNLMGLMGMRLPRDEMDERADSRTIEPGEKGSRLK